LQVQEMDLVTNQPGSAWGDVCAVFRAIYDKIGIGARFASTIGDAFRSAGLENVTVQKIELRIRKALGDGEAAKNSIEPVALNIPSVTRSAKGKFSSTSTIPSR
jgi:hypothetical protein